MARPKHIRDADHESFIDRYLSADTHDERVAVRNDLKMLEGGRFYEMLEAAHKMFCYDMNRPDREAFAEANRNLARWMGVYALVEDLNTFPEYTGVER